MEAGPGVARRASAWVHSCFRLRLWWLSPLAPAYCMRLLNLLHDPGPTLGPTDPFIVYTRASHAKKKLKSVSPHLRC